MSLTDMRLNLQKRGCFLTDSSQFLWRPRDQEDYLKDYLKGAEAMNLSKLFMESEIGLFILFPSLCKGCGFCISKCPMKALHWSDVLGAYDLPTVEIDTDKCVSCGICQDFCPDCAILVIRKLSGECMACATCEWVCTSGAIYINDSLEYILNPEKCQQCGDCFRSCPTGAMSKKACTCW